MNAVAGRSWPLAEVGEEPYSFVASPDGTQIAWATPARRNIGGGGLMGNVVQVANLATGAIHTFTKDRLPATKNYHHGYTLELWGWGSEGLYGRMNNLDTPIIWRLDPSKPNNVAEQVFTVPANSSFVFNAVAEQIAYWDESASALKLHDLRTGSEQAVIDALQATAPDGGLNFAFSPDGTTLAFVRAAGEQNGFPTNQLVLWDVANGTAQPIGRPFPAIHAVGWTTDGRYLLLDVYDVIIEQGPNKGAMGGAAVIVTRDGKFLGKRPNSGADIAQEWRFAIDGQPVAAGYGSEYGVGVTSISFQEGEAQTFLRMVEPIAGDAASIVHRSSTRRCRPSRRSFDAFTCSPWYTACSA